jgi:hypothetical protein
MAHRDNSPVRDLLVVVILIFLFSILTDRIRRYVTLNKHSLIHQLDASFADIINTLQRHLGIARQSVTLLGITDRNHKLVSSIRTLSSQLDEVERKYTRNAPTLALLGPLGTTSIVIKEQELKQKLQYIALGINDVFSQLLDKTPLGREERKAITLDELMIINTQYGRDIRRGNTYSS